MLLNAQHGVLILADTVLSQPEIQAQCIHFQVIIVVSRCKHFITYYRRTQLLDGPNEEDGRLWLQELRVKRPLVEVVRREEPAGTTRSTSHPTPHLVSYTTTNNIKIAILSNSPDQQQYKDPTVAWRRISRHTEIAKAGSAADTSAQAADMDSNISSRKRGRPPGNINHCSKAISGVKARRMEPIPVEEQRTQLSSVDSMGASRIESRADPEVAQGLYPQEAATRITAAMTDLLTTPQSGGQESRTEHGSSTEQPHELSASQRDQADADVMQLNERMAQTAHSARKRKECPTAAEQHYNRSRHMESTQTTSEVQASWETYSQRTIVNQQRRPVAISRRKKVRMSTSVLSPVYNPRNLSGVKTSSSSSSILCVSPDIASDVNVNNMYTDDNLSTEYNASDIDVRSNNEQRRDQDSRTDSRSTVYDDIFDVNPALQAVTFSSTLPLLDGNQEADETAFLCELARAHADDTAYLPCSLPSKGVG